MDERIYHVWFGTKRRLPVLQGEIEEYLRCLLRENAARAAVRLLEVETAVDHVHLVVGVPGDKMLSSAMQQIKGGSSFGLSKKYPYLKADMGQAAFWQKGYSFRRLEQDQVSTARRYVRTQQARPLRHD